MVADWLFAGAFPLESVWVADLALSMGSEEVHWLADFARDQQSNLTLGAWWSGSTDRCAEIVGVRSRRHSGFTHKQ